MNTAWNGSIEPVDVDVGLEAVELAAVAVAPHRDVDPVETALIGSPVEHIGGAQDHPGTRAEHGHAVVDAAWRAASNSSLVVSSFDIVVLSPPGRASASTRSRSAGVRTSGASTPSDRSRC